METYGYGHAMEYVNSYWANRYEKENRKNWDRFYSKGKKGYLASTKNRDYLQTDLAEFLPNARCMLEIGCGGGHAIAPLASLWPELRFLAVDISAKALDVLRANDEVPQDRCEAKVCDVQFEAVPKPSCPAHSAEEPKEGAPCLCAGADIATVIFILSSVAPEAHRQCVRNIKSAMAPGSVLLFRDYARGDANQLDFDKQYPPRKISPNFYVRPDGTRAYFFDLDEAVNIFESEGFVCLSKEIISFKKIGNDRFFVSAKFRLQDPESKDSE